MPNRYTCVNPGGCDCGRVEGEFCRHWPDSSAAQDREREAARGLAEGITLRYIDRLEHELSQRTAAPSCLDPEVCNYPGGRCVEPSRCTYPRREAAMSHNCACLSWRWSNGICTCGVYTDAEDDHWCANENCRAPLTTAMTTCNMCCSAETGCKGRQCSAGTPA